MIYLRVFDIVILLFGEMSEWSKVHDWKSCKVKSLRGFESPSLRIGDRFCAAGATQPRQDREVATVSGMPESRR